MITKNQKSEILKKIETMEKSLTINEFGSDCIEQRCKLRITKSETLLASVDSLAPILRTALVINWRESAMKKRYDRFRKEFPEISNLSQLQSVIDSTDAVNFCKVYLNINANPEKPDANPKYVLLRTLTKGFLEYQKAYDCANEIDALRDWAKNVNIFNLNQDFIGKRKGVGQGVIENIRLNLGYSVIKPDRHVIGVMTQYLKLDIKFERYNDLAGALGLNPRYLDCVMFEFGKLNGISV